MQTLVYYLTNPNRVWRACTTYFREEANTHNQEMRERECAAHATSQGSSPSLLSQTRCPSLPPAAPAIRSSHGLTASHLWSLRLAAEHIPRPISSGLKLRLCLLLIPQKSQKGKSKWSQYWIRELSKLDPRGHWGSETHYVNTDGRTLVRVLPITSPTCGLPSYSVKGDFWLMKFLILVKSNL